MKADARPVPILMPTELTAVTRPSYRAPLLRSKYSMISGAKVNRPETYGARPKPLSAVATKTRIALRLPIRPSTQPAIAMQEPASITARLPCFLNSFGEIEIPITTAKTSTNAMIEYRSALPSTSRRRLAHHCPDLCHHWSGGQHHQLPGCQGAAGGGAERQRPRGRHRHQGCPGGKAWLCRDRKAPDPQQVLPNAPGHLHRVLYHEQPDHRCRCVLRHLLLGRWQPAGAVLHDEDVPRYHRTGHCTCPYQKDRQYAEGQLLGLRHQQRAGHSHDLLCHACMWPCRREQTAWRLLPEGICLRTAELPCRN